MFFMCNFIQAKFEIETKQNACPNDKVEILA